MAARRGLMFGNTVTNLFSWFPPPPPANRDDPHYAPVRISFLIDSFLPVYDGFLLPFDALDLPFDSFLAHFLPPSDDARQSILSCLLSGIRDPHPSVVDFLAAAITAAASRAAAVARSIGSHGFHLTAEITFLLPPPVVEEMDGVLIFGPREEERFGRGRGGELAGAQASRLVRQMRSVEFGEECGMDDKVCSICLAEYEPGMNLKKTRCSHVFHEHCLRRWLERSDSCPLCRSKMATATM